MTHSFTLCPLSPFAPIARIYIRSLPTLLLSALILGSAAQAAEPSDPPKPATETKKEEEKKKEKEKKIKPYDEIITSDAKTRVGLLRTHRIDDKLFYEIPADLLGSDLLWVTQISETTAGNSYSGMPVTDHVVRWELLGDRVLLRSVHFGIRADTKDSIAEAVEASNLAPIIRTFEVKAYGKDKAPVIEVTDLFTKEVAEFNAKSALSAGAMDSGRTFIQEVKAFPDNVEVKVLASYADSGKDTASSGVTAVLHHSMVRLPKQKMKPRKHDPRVGFFTVGFTDYADDSKHEAGQVRYITRWRLEKKDPKAAVSEPVKPIVFYVGREVPDKWKKYVKAGIDDWQPAFEAAGFKNAIQGKLPPDPREDPDWDPEDARISSIRWVPSKVENAFGPHVHDPRTGEILEADVRMYHNVQKLVRDWYFVQAAASDPRAQKLPMPDDLVGELIRFVVAHEVGHSLGFPHNMKASSSYTIAQLRDPEWTKKNGTAPSIMDYARFNYVAQPEDKASMMPKIGPYDTFAVTWGYRQFADDATEKEELEKQVKVQINDPIFRFGDPNPGVDPTQQTEDLGANAVEATALGVKNLNRIAGFLVTATCAPGKDYSLLANMHEQLLRQWSREMGHVVNVVGGVEEINLNYGDAETRFHPLPAAYQRSALSFLVTNALHTPDMFTSSNLILRLTAEGVADRVLSAQRQVLDGIVNARRINRAAENERLQGADSLPVSELFETLRGGLFEEFQQVGARPDVYRRNLQRSYISLLAQQVKNPASDSDLPALARGELQAIRALLGKAGENLNATLAILHVNDLLGRITQALDPKREGN